MRVSKKRRQSNATTTAVRAWVAKANPDRGWRWSSYLVEHDPAGCHWTWVRCPRSMAFIRDRIRANDVILCYETKIREIVGFTLAAGPGRQHRDHWVLDLVAPQQSLHLGSPIKVAQVRESGTDPACFRVGAGRSIHPIEAADLWNIVDIAAAVNRDREREIWDWFEHAQARQRQATANRGT